MRDQAGRRQGNLHSALVFALEQPTVSSSFQDPTSTQQVIRWYSAAVCVTMMNFDRAERLLVHNFDSATSLSLVLTLVNTDRGGSATTQCDPVVEREW